MAHLIPQFSHNFKTNVSRLARNELWCLPGYAVEHILKPYLDFQANLNQLSAGSDAPQLFTLYFELWLNCVLLDLIVVWSEPVVCSAVLLASDGVRFQYILSQD